MGVPNPDMASRLPSLSLAQLQWTSDREIRIWSCPGFALRLDSSRQSCRPHLGGPRPAAWCQIGFDRARPRFSISRRPQLCYDFHGHVLMSTLLILPAKEANASEKQPITIAPFCIWIRERLARPRAVPRLMATIAIAMRF